MDGFDLTSHVKMLISQEITKNNLAQPFDLG